MAADMWASRALDLDAYLGRIGYQGPLEPDAATLRHLHRHHVASIPFENLDIPLGRGIELDLASLQTKLVRCRRGGYCLSDDLRQLLEAAALRDGSKPTSAKQLSIIGTSCLRGLLLQRLLPHPPRSTAPPSAASRR